VTLNVLNGSKGAGPKGSKEAGRKWSKGAGPKGSKQSSDRNLKKGSSGGRRDDAGDNDANIGDFLVVEGNSNQEDAKSYFLEAKSEVLNKIVDKYMDYVVLPEGQTH
jgi:hypothetical protein